MTSKAKPIQNSHPGNSLKKHVPRQEELEESDLSEYSRSEEEEEEEEEEESQSEHEISNKQKQTKKEAYTSEDEEYEEKIKQKYLDEIK